MVIAGTKTQDREGPGHIFKLDAGCTLVLSGRNGVRRASSRSGQSSPSHAEQSSNYEVSLSHQPHEEHVPDLGSTTVSSTKTDHKSAGHIDADMDATQELSDPI